MCGLPTVRVLWWERTCPRWRWLGPDGALAWAYTVICIAVGYFLLAGRKYFSNVIFRSSSRFSRLEQESRCKKIADRLQFVTQLATLCSMRLALEGFIAYPASVGCEALCCKHKPRLSKEGGVFAFLGIIRFPGQYTSLVGEDLPSIRPAQPASICLIQLIA